MLMCWLPGVFDDWALNNFPYDNVIKKCETQKNGRIAAVLWQGKKRMKIIMKSTNSKRLGQAIPGWNFTLIELLITIAIIAILAAMYGFSRM